MIKVGTYVEAAHLFYTIEEMLRGNLDRIPNDEELAHCLDLTPRMVEAIRLRFGKNGVVKKRLVVVAETMDISVERVRQLIGLGLRRVRNFEQRKAHGRQDIYQDR